MINGSASRYWPEIEITSGELHLLFLKSQDELIRPVLAAIPGVAEVATVGGGGQHLQAAVNLEQLRARGLAFTDVVAAVRRGAENGEMSLKRINTIPVRGGIQTATPAVLGDVAHFKLAEDMPTGLADLDGGTPAVGGIVIARRDADPRAVIESVRRVLEKLRPGLRHGDRAGHGLRPTGAG